MSDLLRELRTRVDAIIEPHVQLYGADHPPVKMALLILAEAEQIEQQLGELRVTTDRAAQVTGWADATLQKYARMKLASEKLPPAWAGLIVEDTGSGYSFVVGSIPPKPRAA